MIEPEVVGVALAEVDVDAIEGESATASQWVHLSVGSGRRR
ncbi:MAG: hypothetical protein WCJ66_05050 [Verrucomicrobiota bacterium]